MKLVPRFDTRKLILFTTFIGSIVFVWQYSQDDSLADLARNLLLFYLNCAIIVVAVTYGATYQRPGVLAGALAALLAVALTAQTVLRLEPDFIRFMSLHALTTGMVIWQMVFGSIRNLAGMDSDCDDSTVTSQLIASARKRRLDERGSAPAPKD